MAGSETAQLATSVESLKRELEEAKEKLGSSKSKKMELVALAKVCTYYPVMTLCRNVLILLL
jgi:cell shape-determining protein MreC